MPDSNTVFLEKYSGKLLALTPSNVSSEELIKLEQLLNNIFLDILKEQVYTTEIQEAMLQCLSWTSHLVNRIQGGNKFTASEYMCIKHLANLLSFLAYFLTQSQEN